MTEPIHQEDIFLEDGTKLTLRPSPIKWSKAISQSLSKDFQSFAEKNRRSLEKTRQESVNARVEAGELDQADVDAELEISEYEILPTDEQVYDAYLNAVAIAIAPQLQEKFSLQQQFKQPDKRYGLKPDYKEYLEEVVSAPAAIRVIYVCANIDFSPKKEQEEALMRAAWEMEQEAGRK